MKRGNNNSAYKGLSTLYLRTLVNITSIMCIISIMCVISIISIVSVSVSIVHVM